MRIEIAMSPLPPFLTDYTRERTKTYFGRRVSTVRTVALKLGTAGPDTTCRLWVELEKGIVEVESRESSLFCAIDRAISRAAARLDVVKLAG
jgi:hypothetical protein